MKGRLLLAVVVILGIGLAWWALRPPAPAPVVADAAGSSRVVLRRPATASAKRRPAARAPAAPSDAPIEASTDAPAPPPTTGAPPSEDAPGDGPVDRRPPEQQDGGGLQATVREMMDFASEGVEACIATWGQAEPGRSGELEIGFEFDAEGLSTAWVDEDARVPESTRDCLADAVYAIDWSWLTADPVMVTWRFAYETTAEP